MSYPSHLAPKTKNLPALEEHLSKQRETHTMMNVWVGLMVNQWRAGMLAAIDHIGRRQHEPPMKSVWATITQNASALFSRTTTEVAWEQFEACLKHMPSSPRLMHQQSLFLTQCFSSAKYSDQCAQHLSFLLRHPLVLERQIPRVSVDALVELSVFSQSSQKEEQELYAFMKQSLRPEEMVAVLIALSDVLDMKWKSPKSPTETMFCASLALSEEKSWSWWKNVSNHPWFERHLPRIQHHFPDWYAKLEKHVLEEAIRLPSTRSAPPSRKI